MAGLSTDEMMAMQQAQFAADAADAAYRDHQVSSFLLLLDVAPSAVLGAQARRVSVVSPDAEAAHNSPDPQIANQHGNRIRQLPNQLDGNSG